MCHFARIQRQHHLHQNHQYHETTISLIYISVDTKTQPNKNDDRPYKPPLQSRAQWAG